MAASWPCPGAGRAVGQGRVAAGGRTTHRRRQSDGSAPGAGGRLRAGRGGEVPDRASHAYPNNAASMQMNAPPLCKSLPRLRGAARGGEAGRAVNLNGSSPRVTLLQ